MSLLNGELPLFDLDLNDTLAQYLPKCHTICGLGPIDQGLLSTCRLRDVALTPWGIRTRGWLWLIDRKIDLSNLQTKYKQEVPYYHLVSSDRPTRGAVLPP
jgi:hypothetical protein